MKYVPQTWMPNGTHITCTQSCKSSNTPNDCCSPQHVGDICTHIFMGFHTSSTRDRNWTHHQYCSIQVSFLPKDSVLKTLHLGDWWPSPPSEHRQRSDCQLRWLIACRSCQWLTTNRRPALGQRGCQVAKNCALLKHLFCGTCLGDGMCVVILFSWVFLIVWYMEWFSGTCSWTADLAKWHFNVNVRRDFCEESWLRDAGDYHNLFR